jgi:PAS domain S-box-containing protein
MMNLPPTNPVPEDFSIRLVEGCPDAIVYADAEGRIQFWNAAATTIFGFSESEAIGATLDLIIPERLRARHWQGYREVMAGRATRYGAGALLSVPAQHKDGKPLSIEFTTLPLRDAAGALLGIAAFLRDATARFEEMRALRRELAALKPQPVGAG